MGGGGVGGGWEPDPATAYRRAAGVLGEEVDGEMVLYDGTTGALHVLNRSASLVWQCLDGTVTLAALASEMAAVADADPGRVRGDVVAVTAEFGRLGLLDGVAAAPDDSNAADRGER